MIRAVQGPRLTDSKDSQTFRTDTQDFPRSISAMIRRAAAAGSSDFVIGRPTTK